MGEGYGCSNYHFTYSALAIKFIQFQASPIMHDVTPIFKRQTDQRTTAHTVGSPCMLYM